MSKYDDIINLPHHTSPTRPRMPVADRAAQFAPFSALTGYHAALQETARQPEDRRELTEEALRELDEALRSLRENMEQPPVVRITYFMPEEKKEGGIYLEREGTAAKFFDQERALLMRDGTKIFIDQIFKIEFL